MEVQVRKLSGSWDLGYALHKHTLSSIYIGDDEWGHPRFDNTRSEPGEALYQLKYRSDWGQVEPLAAQVQATLLPLFGKIGLIVPMPASTVRAKQPVNELAYALGRLTGIPVFDKMVAKTPAPPNSTPLKNMHTRAEKDAALVGRFSIDQRITNEGRWNALLLDDLFDTGATMEAVCQVLRTYRKINHIYAAVITWK
ncbi:ComF family protein [Xanthomonas campestris pv. phormiicola]|nr:ComF family protein [Xanthomonas campestris pv. phormiicola]UYC16455.1 ComF family protein [Xanthomonas campestris pv. phormiicola]